MTLDGGWALIISGILVLVLSGVGVLVWRHVDNAQEAAEYAQTSAAKVLEELNAHKLESLRFERHVAETYARTSGVERMESMLSATMVRFETKLDALIGNRSQHHG